MKKHLNFIGAILCVIIAVNTVLFLHHFVAKLFILTTCLFSLCYFGATIQVLKEEERIKERSAVNQDK